MITTCTACQARYRLEDDKIPPRVIRVRCPACSGVFSLDGTQAAVVPAAPAPVIDPIAGLDTTPTPVPADPVPAAATTAPDPVVEPEADGESAPAAAEVDESVSTDFVAAGPLDSSAADPAPETATPSAGVAVMDAEPRPTTRRRRSKEEMLARALVSDILVYNRELRDTALAEGNLLEALGAEIKKSWELYKEKVTPEVANSTNHFREALNEILAEGDKVF